MNGTVRSAQEVVMHEAAHAVVATRVGLAVRYATLSPRERATALVAYRSRRSDPLSAYLAASLAGPMVQDIVTGCRQRPRIIHDARPDLAFARDDARAIRLALRPTGRPTVRAVAGAAWADTYKIVVADYGGILDVASELSAAGRVTGRRVVELLAAADPVAMPSRTGLAADFWPAGFQPAGWWGTAEAEPAPVLANVEV